MKCFGSMDWGYNAPGCFLLWLALPDGHYHIWREVKFQHTPVSEVGEDLKTRLKSLGVKLDYLVADPACWQHTGAGKGEAIGETLQRLGLPMRKGDNNRKNGWQRVHELLRAAPDGTPWLTIETDPHCKYLRRTLAGAVSDKNDADDLDTSSDDHACLTGDTLVTTRDGLKSLNTLGLTDVVLTREGWKPVTAVAMTELDAPLRRIEFSDGSTLTGTDNHPVFVENRGFIAMDALRYGDILNTCPVTTTEQHELAGGSIMARFRRAITSTTVIRIPRTTLSTIWSACRTNSIFASMRLGASTTLSAWQRFAHSLRSGIDQALAGGGTSYTDSWHGSSAFLYVSDACSATTTTTTSLVAGAPAFVQIVASPHGAEPRAWMTLNGDAWFVTSGSASTDTSAPRRALSSARHVVGSSPAGTGTVYNLTVQDCHEYYANGVLVSNCDALRYGAMSRPPIGRSIVRQAQDTPWTLGWLKQQAQKPRGVLAPRSVHAG
jgi:hypothetical protein